MPLKIKNEKILMSAIFSIILMFGTLFTAASAVFVPSVYQTGSQELTRAADGEIHTVIPGVNLLQSPPLTLYQSNDINYDTFAYNLWNWGKSSGSLKGPANRSVFFPTWQSDSAGWLDSGVLLPVFWNFHNQTNDLSASVNWRSRQFPLAVNQNATAILEPNVLNMGLLNVTEEAEYYHLIVQNHQDDATFYMMVIDPQNHFHYEWLVNPGDTIIYPLQYTGKGLYKVIIYVDTSATSFVPVTISVESVEPIVLPVGQLVQGTLFGSEWIVDKNSGGVYYKEQVPTAYTFKIQSPAGRPGRLSYSFNYPELQDGSYETHEPKVIATSNINVTYFGSAGIFVYGLSIDKHEWWYQSYNNQSYYVTIMGLDGVEFSLLNEIPEMNQLPVNTNVFLDAQFGDSSVYAYSLHLSEDSLIIINSTEYNSGYSWHIGTYYKNSYQSDYIYDHSSYSSSSPQLLPAGDYLVWATPNSAAASGFYTITLGPVLDGTGVYPVADSSVIGVRVTADILNDYAVNVSLTTNDNVSVTTKVHLFSRYGYSLLMTTRILGHIQNGFGWTAIGSNFSTYECGLASTHFDDSTLIIAVQPYGTKNTTSGSPTDDMPGKMHTFDIEFVDYMSEAFNGTTTLDATSGSGFRSINLEEPQDSTELYVINLNLNPFKWYNVSIRTSDVTSISMNLYQDYNGRVQMLPWSSLDDTKIGSASDMGIQFGSVGTDAALVVTIQRDAGVDGGYLNLTLTEMYTNSLSPTIQMLNLAFPSITGEASLPSDWLTQNGLVLGAGAVAGVVVVALILVALKKRKS